MKILLIGEYSRLHNSLKEGLEKNGHNVTLVGSGDGSGHAWGCDLSTEYIRINADYTT